MTPKEQAEALAMITSKDRNGITAAQLAYALKLMAVHLAQLTEDRDF